MRDIAPAEQAYNSARQGQIRATLIWLQVRDRATSAPVSLGYWTGPDDQTLTVAGAARLYYGAGAALEIEDIEGGVGLDIRYLRARLAIRPETEQAIRAHDPRLAPVEIHTLACALDSWLPVAPPRRVFLGQVNEAPITLPAEGGAAAIELRMASNARALTRTLPLFKSDAELQRRTPPGGAPDSFRRYLATTGLRQIGWGEELHRA